MTKEKSGSGQAGDPSADPAGSPKADWGRDLRERAEERVQKRTARIRTIMDTTSPEEARQAVHELQVYQLELEMQNEELRLAQAQLEESRARYFDLYDLAPVGYVTLSEPGLILEANLTLATLLGVARGALAKRPFSRFILPEDQDIYYRHRKQLFETGAPQVCEMRMLRAGADPFWARVEGTAAQDGDGAFVCRAVVSDISEHRRDDEALRESEERYRDLVENINDLICTHDQEGRILSANASALKLLGCAPSELLGKNLREILVPEARPRFEQYLETVLREGSARGLMLVQTPAGERRVWEYDNTLRTKGVAAPIVRGLARDVTERKRAEDHELLARDVLERLNDSESTTDTIRDILQMVKKSTGFEAVGIRLREGDDFPYYSTDGFSESFVRMERSLCARNDAGEIVRDGAGNPVLECMCGNIVCGRTDPALPFFTEGGSFWSNCTTDLLASTTEKERQARTRNRCNGEGFESVALIPLRSGGKAIGLLQLNDHRRDRFTLETIRFFEGLGASIGIALARKQTDAALSKSEQELRLITDNVRDTLWLMDMNLRTTWISPSVVRTRGYSLEELAEMPMDKHLAPESLARMGELVAAHLTSEKLADPTCEVAASGEFEYYRKDGSTFWADSVITLLRDKQGRPDMFLGVGRDVTDRKRAEEAREMMEAQFRQAQKMESIGRLAGGVAHDLNNLLTPILGYGELLLHGLASGDTRRDSLEQIVRAGGRARDLVRQLLAFGRKQTMEFKTLDLDKLVVGFEKLLRRTVREDIAIHIVPAPSAPPIRGDVGQLEQVIMNLAVNAQDAMPEGGILTIETAVADLDENFAATLEGPMPGRYVLLVVRDTGHGMDAETRARVFEPFFTTKEVGKGTGLGLATVYGIVRQHGGDVRVESEPGKGATFRIYLPVDPAAAAGPADAERAAPVEDRRGAETILLVEDSEQVRNLVETLLRRQGYTVLVAESGSEALSLLAGHEGPVHLLMTDVVMPGMNGRELSARISQVRPGMKVLFMSGYTSDVLAGGGSLEDGTHFIQKPFTVKALSDQVRAVLDADSIPAGARER